MGILEMRYIFSKSAGWWKYNICIESEIIQYHEATQGVISDQISLGTFKKAYDWSKANPNVIEICLYVTHT